MKPVYLTPASFSERLRRANSRERRASWLIWATVALVSAGVILILRYGH